MSNFHEINRKILVLLQQIRMGQGALVTNNRTTLEV